MACILGEHFKLPQWKACPCGRDVLPEYASSLQQVCVQPAFMATSTMEQSFRYLASVELEGTAEQTMARLVQEAFGLKGESQARAYVGDVAVFDIPRLNLFALCVSFHGFMTWERPFLLKAIQETVRTCGADRDSLVVTVGLLARGARECDGRRRASLSTIINNLKLPDDASAQPLPHIARLQRALAAVIDDVKDEAFQRAFIQPTTLYYQVTHDETVGTDIEAHGASVYLALLISSGGIFLRRPPVLAEGIMGIVDALETGLAEQVELLWSPEKKATPFYQLRLAESVRGRVKRMPNTFVWPWARSTGDFASQAVDASAGNAARRARFARYFQQFCSHFTEEVLLEKLFSALTSGSLAAEASGADSIASDLQLVFDSLREDGRSGAPEDCASPLHWVWDVAEYPPVFNASAARTLLSAIGVVKPVQWSPALCPLHSVATRSPAPAPALKPSLPTSLPSSSLPTMPSFLAPTSPSLPPPSSPHRVNLLFQRLGGLADKLLPSFCSQTENSEA